MPVCSVERGFRFLKDPLFLASSVFVKKPERIVALGLIMVLCLLVYRLAEHRLRTRLAETEQTVPDQLNRPTARPTMRWIFQCFEGIELLHIHSPSQTQSLVLRLQPMHRLVLALLGPPYEKSTKSLRETAKWVQYGISFAKAAVTLNQYNMKLVDFSAGVANFGCSANMI